MPEFIGGDKPEIVFSSRKELADFFRARLTKLLNAEGLASPEDLEQFIANRIDALSHAAFDLKGDGTLRESLIDLNATGILEQVRRREMSSTPYDPHPEPQGGDHGPIKRSLDQPERRAFIIAGLAAGSLLTVHGAIAAATAVDRDRRTRDWPRTALHTAEAVLGGAVAWVSLVALRKPGRIAR